MRERVVVNINKRRGRVWRLLLLKEMFEEKTYGSLKGASR